MTTITTGHPRTPLVAALAAGTALVVGGAIGVAWEQNTNTPAATHSHPNTVAPFGGASTADEFSGSTSGSIPATRSPGGATTSDEFSGSTSGPMPARVAEYRLLQRLNAKVHNPRVSEYLLLQNSDTGATTHSSAR
jgi:hypothetical protein